MVYIKIGKQKYAEAITTEQWEEIQKFYEPYVLSMKPNTKSCIKY